MRKKEMLWMSERVLLIMNPCSGQKRARRYLADILGLFRAHDFVTTVMPTMARGDAIEIIKEHGKNADRIVCIGGDGTFNEVVCGVLDTGLTLPIGYIPAGSTNDFANSLKLPKNIMKAAQLVCEGTPQPLDVGRFSDRYFTYVASFGAFTKTSYSTPQNVKNALGHLAYVLEGIKDIPSIRPLSVRFETPERVVEGKYIFGAVSNSTSVGGILTLSSEVVDMNDGKFELLLIKSPANAIELNEIVLALTRQKYDCSAITFLAASDIEITASPDMDWTLDGERMPGSEHFTVKNLKSAIRLIM